MTPETMAREVDEVVTGYLAQEWRYARESDGGKISAVAEPSASDVLAALVRTLGIDVEMAAHFEHGCPTCAKTALVLRALLIAAKGDA